MTETKAQKAEALARAQAEWREIQLSAEPADFKAAEAAIAALYARLGGAAPYFVRLPSPMAAELYVNLLGAGRVPGISEPGGAVEAAGACPRPAYSDRLMSKIIRLFRAQLSSDLFESCLVGSADDALVRLDEDIRRNVAARLREPPGKDLRQEIRRQLLCHLGRGRSARARDALNAWPMPARSGAWSAVRFGTWEIYSGWFDAGRRAGAVLPPDLERVADLLAEISRSAGWWYPYRDFCILTDRPCILRLDVDDRFHSNEGPAVQYRDGTGIYAWHGTQAPPAWFEGEPLTAAEALRWYHTEERRVACEMLGWATVLRELDAHEIDRHANPMIGTLVQVQLPYLGKRRFLRVMCGTGREFALRVPLHVHTAIEAQSLIQRIPPEMVERIEVRT